MASEAGVSAASVQRMASARSQTAFEAVLQLSNDKQFEEKFWDVIGYLDPPEKALILCCDEKSQCRVGAYATRLAAGGWAHSDTDP